MLGIFLENEGIKVGCLVKLANLKDLFHHFDTTAKFY